MRPLIMVCSSCGAEIADKAIVCYRCGTPTAIPAAPERKAPPRRRPVWPPLVILVAIVALAAWFIPRLPPDSGLTYAAYVAVVIAALLALRLVIRR